MSRREEKKQKKRERLLSEGRRLFLAQGYDRTSIEQIVGGAEVARGTFYLYFRDKLALFEAIADGWFEPLLALLREVDAQLETAQVPLESLLIYLELGERLVSWSVANRETVLMVFREARAASDAGERLRARDAQLQQAILRLTEHAAERGLITVEDPRVTSLVVLGAVERLHYEWLVGDWMDDPDRVAREVVHLFGRAFGLPEDAVNG